jgi:hypothetical protein
MPEAAAAAAASASASASAAAPGGSHDESGSSRCRREDWQVLVEDWGFGEELARQFDACSAAWALIELAASTSGFQVSDEAPLLVGIVDAADPDSAGYADAGNYGIAAGSPGRLEWPGGGGPPPAAGALPLPEGVAAAPPRALWNYLRAMPGVVDASGDGSRALVFHVENLERLHEIQHRMMKVRQFRRMGPIFAAEACAPPVAPQRELVRFYTIERLNGPPHYYAGFTTFP